MRSWQRGVLAALVVGFTMRAEPELIVVTDEEAVLRGREIVGEMAVKVAEGLEVSLWATDQLMGDPVGLHMDEQGRAWITVTSRRRTSMFDIREHVRWMSDTLSWSTVEERKAFLHRDLASERSALNPWLVDVNEDGTRDWRDLTVVKENLFRIEDTSGDGMADRGMRYYSGFNEEISDIAGTILYHEGAVYAGVAPDLWRILDTDGDERGDVADSISSGYGVRIGFGGHGMSGLRIGPDGRLYWSIGDVGLNTVGPDGEKWVYPEQGVIVRSELDGSGFEVYAAGGRNTHEFDFDQYGNLISVDNDGDHAGETERLVYLINGSDSGWRMNWQFGKYSDPKNNGYKVWMDEGYFKPRFEGQAAHLLPPLAAYRTGPAGFVFNPGTALSQEWANHFFVAEFTGVAARSAVHAFTLQPEGASFALLAERKALEGVLVTGLSFGPDGALYLADWVDGWATKQKGRIWKLDTPSTVGSATRKETQALLEESFAAKDAVELRGLLGHADMRVRKKAQFALAARGEVATLVEAAERSSSQLGRIHGIWGLAQIARREQSAAEPLLGLLDDGDAEIRAQAAKLLGDVRYDAAAEALEGLLSDVSLRVRLLATEALGRIGHRAAFGGIVTMLEVNDDADVYLRHAGAIALARLGDEESLAALARHTSRAVRVAVVVALQRLGSPLLALYLEDEDEYVATSAARGINDDAHVEGALKALARMLDTTRFAGEALLRRSINANLYVGTAENARSLAAFAKRDAVAEAMRVEALDTLRGWADASVYDRVSGRFRGERRNDVAEGRAALGEVAGGLLADELPAVREAAARAAGSLGLVAAEAELMVLAREDGAVEVRVAALEALVALQSSRLQEAIALSLKDGDATLRMRALGLVTQLGWPEADTAGLLALALESGATPEKQAALRSLGAQGTAAAVKVLAEQLEKLEAGTLDTEIELDAMLAAEATGSEVLRGKLLEIKAARAAGADIPREALHGGSAEAGERIFFQGTAAQCVRCHAVGGQGGDAGPALDAVGARLSREGLLRSLVNPSADIAMGYGMVGLQLRSGKSVFGVLRAESAEELVVFAGGEGPVTVAKAEVARRDDGPSTMPPMGLLLSTAELRDVVAYLAELREGDGSGRQP